MSTFSAPATIDAMVAAFQAISGLTTLDGPAPEPSADDLLQVAIGSSAVVDNLTHEPGLGLAQTEGYTISNRLWSRRGSGTYKERRDAVDGFLGAVKAVIDGDKTFGGACLWAQLGRVNQWPAYSGTGLAYVADFGIVVRARVP